MVLHPSCLEGGVLPVVTEHQQPLPLGVVHHVLGKDMHIGDVDRAHPAAPAPDSLPPTRPRGCRTKGN